MKNQKVTGKGSSQKTPPSSSDRKTRWESGNPPPDTTTAGPGAGGGEHKPKPSISKVDSVPIAGSSKTLHDPISPSLPLPFPDSAGILPPPPAYGFHMLDRRTIVLADGSVRSYFALPADYSPDTLSRSMDTAEKFFPYGPAGQRPDSGPGGGLGLEFEKRFHRSSPEGFRRDRDEPFGRGGSGSGPHDYWSDLGREGRGLLPSDSSLKRKYGDEEARDSRDEFARQRQQLLQYGNPNTNPNGFPLGSGDYSAGTSSPFRRDPPDSGRGIDDFRMSKHLKVRDGYDDLSSRRGGPSDDLMPSAAADVKLSDVNQDSLKKAFLRFTKSINENSSQRKNYLEDGKYGPMQCLACGRSSKEYTDIHGLIMHTYNSQTPDLRVEHLGLHKALCVLMGWNYAKVPENSKAYQSLSASEAAANRDDLIIWPPTVIIHNTNSGRGKGGRMEGMGNKEMDNKLKELGFSGGKSKSMYGKDGHMGVTVVKFAEDRSGLKEAERLAEFFEKESHGRRGWARAQDSQTGKDDDEKNPDLVKVDEKTGEKKRIFYAYFGTAADLDKVDFDMKKKAVIKSRREFDLSK
eukprot:TRINITY_DN26697_c0_g1_i1.p1 TRINITY_DN26697_c0_g1~~TRINITY_DN26697_c0_g1_i1.p1  ORF type:complete len:575 (+),score=84.96 TRINITY_DN26697_c0_g1_i1:220-1944(+)